MRGTIEKTRVRVSLDGLSEAEAAENRAKFGSNRITQQKKVPFWRQFVSNLNDPIIKILIAALLISTAFTFSDLNWAETCGIAATILISTLVTTISEHSSASSFERLYSTLADVKCRVIREGRVQELAVSELVRYDVVELYPGDTVPADGITIEGEVKCDESPLTGESRSVEKRGDRSSLTSVTDDTLPENGAKNALFRGCHVVSGKCKMLVLAVGDRTQYGSIAGELGQVESSSPLRERLTSLARTISKIGYVSAAVVALVALIDSFWFDAGQNAAVALMRLQDIRFVAAELIHALTLAISIVVVAVPEGLPMMITVVLTSNMKKMMRAGVLVRRLVGIETAGSVDVLFTDKTGTLTTGKLRIHKVVTADGEHDLPRSLPEAVISSLWSGAEVLSGVKNHTEAAISAYLGVRKTREADESVQFDSARKYAAARVGERVYIRGAAEYLLPRCGYYIDSQGRRQPMNRGKLSDLEAALEGYMARSYRVLIQAEAGGDTMAQLKNGLDGAGDFTFIAMFIIADQVRSGVPEAVRECKTAGIHVIMLTGDNLKTALSVARDCGITEGRCAVISSPTQPIPRGRLAIDGSALRLMDDGRLTEILDRVDVISRVTPTDKSRLVRLAKAQGHIVGMTGDGINDAPALKSADVGFAMGSGSDVARDAGDIVITDDNFVSITKAVLFGRTIFRSIRRFITFQLTMNMAAVGVSVIGRMFGVESPVTVIQMLWVNIIMDTLGSLAFAGEPALKEYMTLSPVKRDEHILTPPMVWEIVLTGVFAVALSLYFLLSPDIRHAFGGGELHHQTLFFAFFIFLGIGIAFCTRTEKVNIFSSIGKNRAFLLIMPAVAAVQLLIIYFGGDTFRCMPLEPRELFWCWLFSCAVIPAVTIRKAVGRMRK